MKAYLLSKTDLVNLVTSVQPDSIQECCKLTDKGLMYFSGDQHNENWNWEKNELMKLSESKLTKMYNKYKK